MIFMYVLIAYTAILNILFICISYVLLILLLYSSEDSEVIIHSNDPVAPVGYLIFKKLYLELKLPALDLNSRLEGLPLKDSNGYITDQEEEEVFQITENEIGKCMYFVNNYNLSFQHFLNTYYSKLMTYNFLDT